MGLSCHEILEVISRSDRCYQTVRGYVAEKHLEIHLSRLKSAAAIDDWTFLDADGQPDFLVRSGNVSSSIECKNVLKSFRYANGDLKVDFQRTRNQLEGKAGRFYKPSDFDILAACEYNQLGTWTFKFIRTVDLVQETVDGIVCCKKAVHVPVNRPIAPWTTDLTEIL